MPHSARSTQHASYFHVINRSAGRLVLFRQPADYRAFLSILGHALEHHPVRLIAYCLMPNHWQLVVGPTDTMALSSCLQRVTSTHAARLHHHRRSVSEDSVYQNHFDSLELRGLGDLMLVCRSVERDAVQARLVRRAQDWPWASLSERLQPSTTLPLVNTPFLSSRAWADYVNARRPSASLDDFAEAPRRLA
jgi:putative transposase